jgi:hypothetical protein
MAAGLFGSDDYTNAFVWGETLEREGTPAEVAAAVAAEIETAHPGEINWKPTVDKLRKESD